MVRERLLCPARDIAPSLRVIKDLFRGERLDLTDGVKVTWPDRWLLARPSATEPVIRLAAEAPAESRGAGAREPRPRGAQPGSVNGSHAPLRRPFPGRYSGGTSLRASTSATMRRQ